MEKGLRIRARTGALAHVRGAIISCEACPRLRTYCAEVGRVKKRAHRDDTYWARPVPGFGDPGARMLVLGLAPAAHGANRTGRVFTGDGTGGSGDFLMAALHAAGFANQPFSRDAADGLVLTDAYISAAVRCAPPDNTPTPEEITRCLDHLVAEVAALPRLSVVVALGGIAFASWLKVMDRLGAPVRPRPAFGHGVMAPMPAGRPLLVGCYHPSRQNTNTGRLTQPMMRDVFRRARRRLDG